MTWNAITDVTGPVEAYDAVHAEVLRAPRTAFAGLLVHLARPTPGGFQIVEVWESRAQFDRSSAEVLEPIMTRMFGGPPSPDKATATEFELRGLVLPAGGIFR